MAAKDRYKSVQASLFADPFIDSFQSWAVVLRSIRAYRVGRRSLTAVRQLDNRRTAVLSSLWRAEHPAARPPPPSTIVLKRHHSYLFDFSVRHWPGAVIEPSGMRSVTLWRLPFSDVLRELNTAHLRRSLRLKSYLGIFGALPVDMLERSMVQLTRSRYSGMLATMFADHLADCYDGWRATQALIRARPTEQPNKKPFKVIEEGREQALINYCQSLPALSGSCFPTLPAVGRVTDSTSGLCGGLPGPAAAATALSASWQRQRHPIQLQTLCGSPGPAAATALSASRQW